MQYFLLGLGLLALLLLAARGFTQADAAALARRLRVGGGIAALAIAAILLVRGMLTYAMLLGSAGLWLLASQHAGRWGGFKPAADGRTSRVATQHLEMELDHASGAMRGRVIHGRHVGTDLADLRPIDLVGLWQDYRFADPASAQLLEAYLDRELPSWRDDHARAAGGHADRDEGPSRGGTSGAMSREEALAVLGLETGADEAAIRRAHRDLMQKVHPDRGGSSFLAAKINEAKDVLLRRS